MYNELEIEAYVTEGIPEYVMSLFPRLFKGVVVDVGAYHPFWINNSWIFEVDGWDTYCIEPNPNCIKLLQEHRENVIQVACGAENKDNVPFYIYTVPYGASNSDASHEWCGEGAGTGLINHKDKFIPNLETPSVVKVFVRTLDYIMENIIEKDKIDFLSIDVEGSEMSVLKGTSLERWKPKVIVIESNHDYELLEQKNYLVERGYRYILKMGVNSIYILQSYYKEVYG